MSTSLDPFHTPTWPQLARAAQYNCQKLAALCHCSLRHLERLAARHHQTPRQLLHAARMNAALPLLTRENWKLAAIAHELHFHDAPHFCRAFKQHFGQTPHHYRLTSQVAFLQLCRTSTTTGPCPPALASATFPMLHGPRTPPPDTHPGSAAPVGAAGLPG